jgi:hypothetical protein
MFATAAGGAPSGVNATARHAHDVVGELLPERLRVSSTTRFIASAIGLPVSHD